MRGAVVVVVGINAAAPTAAPAIAGEQRLTGRSRARAALEQLLREGNELVRRQAAMSVVHRLGERVGDAGTDANERGFLDAELGCDLVGGEKADTANVAGQPVGVLRDQSNGIRTIGLVDAHRPRGADAVA